MHRKFEMASLNGGPETCLGAVELLQTGVLQTGTTSVPKAVKCGLCWNASCDAAD